MEQQGVRRRYKEAVDMFNESDVELSAERRIISVGNFQSVLLEELIEFNIIQKQIKDSTGRNIKWLKDVRNQFDKN